MSFEDLPTNWPTIPLTEPAHVADVLDIFVSMRDRAIGSLLVLICDEERRPGQPVVITEIRAGDACTYMPVLRQLVDTVADANPRASLLFAIARRDGLRVTSSDLRWQRSIEQACGGRLELLGVHVITFDGSIPIPAAQAA
jgi:hypothetical protein